MLGFINNLFRLVTLLLEHFKTLRQKQEEREQVYNQNKAIAYDKLQKALAARRAVRRSTLDDERMSEDPYKREQRD